MNQPKTMNDWCSSQQKEAIPGWLLRLGLLLAVLQCAGPAGAQVPTDVSRFRVHPEATFQTMAGFGAGFNQGTQQNINAIKREEGRARAYDLLYGDEGARLNTIRLTISPNARPAVPKQVLPDGHVGSVEYDWAGDEFTQAVWNSIQPVMKRTRPILYAVPFSPPPQWKTTGRTINGGELIREHYRDYAEYLAGFLDYYHKVLQVDIDVLSLQNEPGVAAPLWASCVWKGEELREFLEILSPVVRARGLKTRFMLSEGTAWSGAWEHLLPTLEDPVARNLLSIMASHSYGAPDDKARKLFAEASAKTGLPVWMSEMSLMSQTAPDDPSMNAAIQIARYMHRDIVGAHASVWIYCFAIFSSKLHGSMGVLSPADENGLLVVPKRFWAMANYSRFVRPGWKLMQIDGTGYANTGFVNPKGDGFVIVALNPDTKPCPTSYDFGDRKIGAVEGYATTANLDLARTPPPSARPRGFDVILPPVSVTTFVGRLENQGFAR